MEGNRDGGGKESKVAGGKGIKLKKGKIMSEKLLRNEEEDSKYNKGEREEGDKEMRGDEGTQVRVEGK